jgi:protein ImuB
MLGLFRERLQRVELPEATEALTLRAADWVPLAARVSDLFAAKSGAGISPEELIEILQARLGHAAVRGIAGVAEHRPEYAWRYRDVLERVETVYFKQRPLWLLPEPVPLGERGGALVFEAERERIEGGWWDERAIARDYFIVRAADGAALWVFRELTGARRWMLHGVFA